LKRKLNYGRYFLSLPFDSIKDDENRSVITLCLTKLLLQQNLQLSFFTYHSPSDEDGYLRTNVSYKVSDDFEIESGLNYFYGANPVTFFSQFEKASNVYASARYSF